MAAMAAGQPWGTDFGDQTLVSETSPASSRVLTMPLHSLKSPPATREGTPTSPHVLQTMAGSTRTKALE
eukprot:11273685-Alexandrium_andersonii.AAC.1